MSYSKDEQSLMLATALAAIKHGLQNGAAADAAPAGMPACLAEPRACFVTLKDGADLRGCIGSLEAHTGLLAGIAEHAAAAAFRDPRFPPLASDELPALTIEISVLSPPLAVDSPSEQALLAEMVPGEAGWVLEDAAHRGTFLPSVWTSLDEPRDFLRELKRKAGLAPDYWSGSIKVWRYTTTSFAAPVADIGQSPR